MEFDGWVTKLVLERVGRSRVRVNVSQNSLIP